MKYPVNAFRRCILPKYILPFFFRNLNFRDYDGDSLNVMFPWFSNCFLPFPQVFPHVSTVSFGVSPIFRQCFLCFLFSILWNFTWAFDIVHFHVVATLSFFAGRSFPKIWLLSSLEFQLVSSDKRCSISNIMVILYPTLFSFPKGCSYQQQQVFALWYHST